MNKLIGLVTGYGVEHWVEASLKQAIEYCDEVIVSVGAKSPVMKKFEDKTLDICIRYKDKVKLLVIEPDIDKTAIGTAIILNTMLQFSDLFEEGNWIWILDSDEFYHRKSFEFIKSVINQNIATHITVESYMFLINMQHYVEASNERLLKITNLNKKDDPLSLFIPTQHWNTVPYKIEATIPRKYGMFHYSLLKNPYMRIFQWEHEQPSNKQNNKVRWGNEIYKYYDLSNEDYWLDKNLEVSGIRHPWFSDSYKADKNGHLFVYDGLQPEYIEETDLPKIEDFRKFYKFN